MALENFTRRRSFLSVSLILSPNVLASSSFCWRPPRTSSIRAVVGSVLLSYSHGLTRRQKTSSRLSRRRTVVLPPPHGAVTPTVTGSRSGRVTTDSTMSTTSSKPSRSMSLGLSSRRGITGSGSPADVMEDSPVHRSNSSSGSIVAAGYDTRRPLSCFTRPTSDGLSEASRAGARRCEPCRGTKQMGTYDAGGRPVMR